jgi:hypothetical protein
MAVTASYDAQHALVHAQATLSDGARKKTVRVEIKDGQATLKRDAGEMQEFAAPRGVIVTSAPDWTDTFLLCRYYDRKKGGKQEFPALWIHPEQPGQRLTFLIERVGMDTIDHQSRKLGLQRYRIRIRNNSAYVAWTDGDGEMIKLMSLPVKGKGGTTLVREGYESSAAPLHPPEP